MHMSPTASLMGLRWEESSADSSGGGASADAAKLRQHSLAAAAATADGQFTARFLSQANRV